MKASRLFWILALCPLFTLNLQAQISESLFVLNKRGHSINRIDLDIENVSSQELAIPREKVVNPYGLSRNLETGSIAWIDRSSKSISWLDDLENIHSYNIPNQSYLVDICQKDDQTYLIIDSEEKAVYEVDLINKQQILITKDSINNPSSIVYSKLRNQIYWTDLESKKIFRYSFENNSVSTFFESENNVPIRLLLHDEQNKLFISDDINNEIFIIDLESKAKTQIYKGDVDDAPYGMALSLDFKFLYWTDYSEGSISSIDLETKEIKLISDGYIEPIDIVVLDLKVEKRSKEIQKDLVFKIYPNPTIGDVNFIVENQSCASSKLIVYDSQGHKVQEALITKRLTQMNTENLSAGIYICALECNNNVYEETLIITK